MSLKNSGTVCIKQVFVKSSLRVKGIMSLPSTVKNGMRRHGKKSCCWKSPHGALRCRRIGLGDIVPHLDRLFYFFSQKFDPKFLFDEFESNPVTRCRDMAHLETAPCD